MRLLGGKWVGVKLSPPLSVRSESFLFYFNINANAYNNINQFNYRVLQLLEFNGDYPKSIFSRFAPINAYRNNGRPWAVHADCAKRGAASFRQAPGRRGSCEKPPVQVYPVVAACARITTTCAAAVASHPGEVAIARCAPRRGRHYFAATH